MGSLVLRNEVREVATGRQRGKEREEVHAHTGREKKQREGERREIKMSGLYRKRLLREGKPTLPGCKVHRKGYTVISGSLVLLASFSPSVYSPLLWYVKYAP